MNAQIASPTAVQADDLSVRFGRTNALTDVRLTVPTGSLFALIGPNGAGKTTLIKTLLNLRRPTTGSVDILGHDSTSVRGRALERIGYVSENQELPGWMTLEALLAYLRPFYPTWDRELERTLLAQFRLPAGRKLKQMSRGQQMKASLLAALAYRPALLILDEPFSGLDPLARDEFVEGLLDQAASANETGHPMTTLISSHDLAEIESFATHIAYLDNGQVLFAEEIATLTDRFREVTVVLDTSVVADSIPNRPSSWLLPEQNASTLRFIHSQAVTEPVAQQIATLLPHATRTEAQPMSLRSIFLALARSSAPQATAGAGGRA